MSRRQHGKGQRPLPPSENATHKLVDDYLKCKKNDRIKYATIEEIQEFVLCNFTYPEGSSDHIVDPRAIYPWVESALTKHHQGTIGKTTYYFHSSLSSEEAKIPMTSTTHFDISSIKSEDVNEVLTNYLKDRSRNWEEMFDIFTAEFGVPTDQIDLYKQTIRVLIMQFIRIHCKSEQKGKIKYYHLKTSQVSTKNQRPASAKNQMKQTTTPKDDQDKEITLTLTPGSQASLDFGDSSVTVSNTGNQAMKFILKIAKVITPVFVLVGGVIAILSQVI